MIKNLSRKSDIKCIFGLGKVLTGAPKPPAELTVQKAYRVLSARRSVAICWMWLTITWSDIEASDS
jgi:hypothetical protein